MVIRMKNRTCEYVFQKKRKSKSHFHFCLAWLESKITLCGRCPGNIAITVLFFLHTWFMVLLFSWCYFFHCNTKFCLLMSSMVCVRSLHIPNEQSLPNWWKAWVLCFHLQLFTAWNSRFYCARQVWHPGIAEYMQHFLAWQVWPIRICSRCHTILGTTWPNSRITIGCYYLSHLSCWELMLVASFWARQLLHVQMCIQPPVF